MSLTPGTFPGFSLDYIDWSHSLLMSLVWSAVFAGMFIRRGRAVIAALALAVFSHFVLDLVMHPADLALWPGSKAHLGFGLWRIAPPLWWFVELAIVAAGMWFYWQRSRRDGSYGRWAAVAVAAVILLHIVNSPWLSVT